MNAALTEVLRQQALDRSHILNTEEPDYHDIVVIAAMVCGTSVAAISFLDHRREWFKARLGIEHTELDRVFSFCAHVVQHPQKLMQVSDAARDARFAGNPLVKGAAKIRFYAGAPLVTASGIALGTLSVMDRQPGSLTAAQAEALVILARRAIAHLELRQAYETLSQINNRISEQNLTDALTCIPNRRAFNERLDLEITRAARFGEPLCLLMVDLDHFKGYNDRFGHQAGDQALYLIAQLMRDCIRHYDFVARYGGEEFAIILPRTELKDAARLAERIRADTMVNKLPQGWSTLSIGVAALSKPYIAHLLLRAADMALYEAKAAGRNRVVINHEKCLPDFEI